MIDLLRGLLDKDPSTRLSYKNIQKIKKHPWCKDMPWDNLITKDVQPPWLPDLEKSNFDPEYTNLPLDFSELDT